MLIESVMIVILQRGHTLRVEFRCSTRGCRQGSSGQVSGLLGDITSSIKSNICL